MRVKPKEGMTLLNPETGGVVPVEGIEVSDNDLYWVRRLRDGDAEKVEEHHQRRQHAEHKGA